MSRVPKVSIVMPSFQQAVFLEEAVRSVLEQREVETELIVMDPGSTDGSREILLELKKEYGERLVLHFEPDKGQSDAIQRGMGMAKGNVLAWLNSDDRLLPGALAVAVSCLDGDGPRWMYGRCGIINEQGEQISRPIVWYKNLRGRRFSIYKLLTEDFIPQMSTFWNRAIWEQSGGLDIDRHLDMDYDLFLRFARIAEPRVIPAYLADFRVHRAAKGSRGVIDTLNAAQRTARQHAAGLGMRGQLALLLHAIFRVRTYIVYRLIKP